ncbi:C-GCAxxG-C-C family protein [Merdimonas faecis]
MTQEEIRELFIQGIDCSQVVTGRFAVWMGMVEDDARKMSSCFGGGMMCGETCGAVTGALMVIGMNFGHSRKGDQEQKQIMSEKVAEFKRLFLEKYPSCMCRELLGHDISKPGEMDKVMEKGLLLQFCPEVVDDTIRILEKIL